jgi:hypothetical protein
VIEPEAAPKFDMEMVAGAFGLAPREAALAVLLARGRQPLIVRDPQLVTTAGTRKYCQRFAPFTAVSANFSRRSETQSIRDLQVSGKM